MPWAVLVRVLVRLAGSLALWRIATLRRGRYATAGARPVASPVRPPRLDAQAAAAALREGASLGWRLLAAGVFGVAFVVLVTAGLTTTVLSPRWLGTVLLVLAAAAAAAAMLEVRGAVRIVTARRRRRRAQDLRRQVS